MRRTDLPRKLLAGLASTLMFLLLGGARPAEAQDEGYRKPRPVVRNLYLSNSPSEEVPDIFIAAWRVTALVFEGECDPAETKLLGWEGRFEPVQAGGRFVLLYPLKPLAPDDRFLLQVALKDGTKRPFTLVAGRERVDAQVNVFLEPESPGKLRAFLDDKSEENRSLRQENERYRQEQASVDHALATLLANNQVGLTPFKQRRKWMLRDKDFRAVVVLFDAPDRTAVVLEVSNLDAAREWKLEEMRLLSERTAEARPFAYRMLPAAVPPKGNGVIAVVTNKQSFLSKDGVDRLVLEFFRDGGLQQGYVVLQLETQPER